MKVHRFTAPDMRQAIRHVRREFGPDAVILKSEPVEGGVQVVCGTDFDEQQLDHAPVHLRQPPRDPARPAQTRAAMDPALRPRIDADAAPATSRGAPVDTGANAAIPPAQVEIPQLQEMRRELRSLRGLLRTELASLVQTNLEQNQPLRADILRKCGLMGLEPALSRRLTEGVVQLRNANDAWRATLSALIAAMPQSEYDLLSRGGCFAFYGPAGVGKTTAVVRIAAQFARRYGRQSVGLVSADSRRPGAQTEMLRRGQELGVYTLAVQSAADTREAIDLLADRRLILVDTAAMTPRDAQLAEQAALLRSLPQLRPWLVLSATTQGSALRDMVRDLATLRPAACVLTRLDECVALGEALSVTVDCGLPIALVSCGPEREDDLLSSNAQWLVRRMVDRYRARRDSRDQGDADTADSLVYATFLQDAGGAGRGIG
jgi:flagellar biosynthesis protein FlhF